MKVNVVSKKNNPLLNRQDIVVSIDHAGKPTPSRNGILAAVEKELKAEKETIIIDRIFTKRGQSLSDVRVLVYKKKDDIPQGKLQKMERKKKAKKEGGKPAEKKEEKPAGEKEEKTEEKAEPVKEEKKQENPEEKPETKPEEKKEGSKQPEPKKEEKPAEGK